MRIARFTTGEDPQYGVVTGDLDEFGQPAEDSVVVALAGDPLYVGVKLLDQEHKLSATTPPTPPSSGTRCPTSR